MKIQERFSITVCLLMSFLSVPEVLSHGLDMTTAQVTLRQNNHITIKINTSLKALLERLEWQGKPANYIQLARLDVASLTALQVSLRALFESQMQVEIGGSNMISKQVRLPKEAELLSLIKQNVSAFILQQSANNQDSAKEIKGGRSRYLSIIMDGFIDTSAQNKMLHINFPKVLGGIMVSYSKPSVQSFKNNNKQTNYYQLLE